MNNKLPGLPEKLNKPQFPEDFLYVITRILSKHLATQEQMTNILNDIKTYMIRGKV